MFQNSKPLALPLLPPTIATRKVGLFAARSSLSMLFLLILMTEYHIDPTAAAKVGQQTEVFINNGLSTTGGHIQDFHLTSASNPILSKLSVNNNNVTMLLLLAL